MPWYLVELVLLVVLPSKRGDHGLGVHNGLSPHRRVHVSLRALDNSTGKGVKSRC